MLAKKGIVFLIIFRVSTPFPSMVLHTWNPSTQRIEAGKLGVQCQPQFPVTWRTAWDT